MTDTMNATHEDLFASAIAAPTRPVGDARTHRPLFVVVVRDPERAGWHVPAWASMESEKPNLYFTVDGARRAVKTQNARGLPYEIRVLDLDLCDSVSATRHESLHDRFERAERQWVKWGAQLEQIRREMAGTVGGAPVDADAPPPITPAGLVAAAVAWTRAKCSPACDEARHGASPANPDRTHIAECPKHKAALRLRSECEYAFQLYGRGVPI